MTSNLNMSPTSNARLSSSSSSFEALILNENDEPLNASTTIYPKDKKWPHESDGLDSDKEVVLPSENMDLESLALIEHSLTLDTSLGWIDVHKKKEKKYSPKSTQWPSWLLVNIVLYHLLC